MKVAKTKGVLKIKAGLSVVGIIELAKFRRKARNAKKAQEATLRAILTESKDTVFGKEHDFESILQAKTTEELYKLYDEKVKISLYEDLQPYIERHKQGETDVLFPGKPIMYATTSGTTNTPKWIPITKKYYKEVFSKMNQVWFYTAQKHRPHVFDGKTVSIVGKAVEGAAPDGTLYGSISGMSQRDIPKFMYPIYSAPHDIFLIEDYKARYYAIMRISIEQNITWIITANSSTLIEMQNNVNEFYDDYLNDIENGTISDKFDISPEIRTALLAGIKPNPERAQELRDLRAKLGTVLPKHYWPNLQVITVWLCGNTKVYFEKVKDSFPDNTLFFEFSYFASECKTGMVIDPRTKDTVLAANKIFFEFIKEEEFGTENPKIYQTHELELWQRYDVIVTTPSGLYRYNMNDIVIVTGKYKDFPKIQFIQKASGIISLTGEKLSERQFIDAVHAAEKEARLSVRFFVGFADVEFSVYDFYYEFSENVKVTKEEADNFTRLVDENLKKMNPEYADKRNSDRLKDPQGHFLPKQSFETFKARCIDLGYREGQFKLTLLMQDEKRHAMFRELEGEAK
ncbi:MAG: GH3 auxin-responsive promoter family protein [Prevotellaceae bacterium]|jgi:hypothetical protein|nr:GH3 auxin-responsive promoter family protein [Prevotellaceae bacterium]